MFNWLRRFFRPSHEVELKRFFQSVDTMNAQVGGGQPTTTTKVLGTLNLRSGTIVLGDPQHVPGLEVSNIIAGEVVISASLWRYPSGAETVTGLTIHLSDPPAGSTRCKIGEINIDSAKLVVADKADIDQYWTEFGNDRIGVISTAPDDTVLRVLMKRFSLETVRVNSVRAEVVGLVSEALEKQIDEYLKSQPKYADYPFMYFRVQTNNSFDRANYMTKAWDFLSFASDTAPMMFVCKTGRGDGTYDVEAEFAGQVPCILRIAFIED